MAQAFTSEIVRHIAVLGQSAGSWNKELNLVSWNGCEPKLDVRVWSPDHEKCGRGTTLTYEEAQDLCKALTQHLRGENL